MPYQSLDEPAKQRRRSKAWIFYGILAALGMVGSIASLTMSGLLASALVGLYAWYLYRGGRFVIWFF